MRHQKLAKFCVEAVWHGWCHKLMSQICPP
jgi:hypothetical protein